MAQSLSRVEEGKLGVVVFQSAAYLDEERFEF
jgi:hypothetical protein